MTITKPSKQCEFCNYLHDKSLISGRYQSGSICKSGPAGPVGPGGQGGRGGRCGQGGQP